MIAKRGSRNVHMIVPNKKEWLSVLVCVNAKGESLPNFFIFKRKKLKYNYLQKIGDKEATMTMQPKVWMTHLLFKD